MSNTIVNTAPYLRVQREFPEELAALALEIDKTYIDIAAIVNARTIGIYPETKASITGNKWYLGGKEQQTLRKVFKFTATTNIVHKIEANNDILQAYGMYTDGTDWFGIIANSSTAIAGQVGFYITSTDIVFTVDAGAPALSKGTIVIEWLSSV